MAEGGVGLVHCGICMEDMASRSPRALSCLHTFCLQCLQSLYQKDADFLCPTCRQKPIMPNNGVVGLPENFMFKEFINILDATKCCEFCDKPDVEAAYFCVDCDVRLCDNCMKSHLLNILCYSHNITPLDESTSKNICKQHKVKIAFICNQCQEEICSKCFTFGSHSNHKQIEKIPQRRNHQNYCAKVLQISKAKLAGIESCRKLKDETEKQINRHRDEMIQMILKHSKELCETVNKTHCKIVDNSVVLVDVCHRLQKLKKANGDIYGDIKQALNEINSIPNVSTPVFIPNEICKVGRVTCESSSAINNVKLTPKQEEPPRSKWTLEEGPSYDKIDFGNTKITPGGLPAVRTAEARLKSVISKPARDVQLTSGMGFLNPGSVVSMPQGGVLVADRTRPNVALIDGEGQTVFTLHNSLESGGVEDISNCDEKIYILHKETVYQLTVGEGGIFHAKEMNYNKGKIRSIVAYDPDNVLVAVNDTILSYNFETEDEPQTIAQSKANIVRIRVGTDAGGRLIFATKDVEKQYFDVFDSSGTLLRTFSGARYSSEVIMSPFGRYCVGMGDIACVRMYLPDLSAHNDIILDCGSGVSSLSLNYPYIWCVQGSAVYRYKIYK